MKKILVLIVFASCCSSLFGGVFYEHKKIGDLALMSFIKNFKLEEFFLNTVKMKRYGYDLAIPYVKNHELVNYYQNMFYIDDGGCSGYSYGDLSALSGDHSLDMIQILQGLFTDAVFTGVPQADVFRSLVGEMKNALSKQKDAIDNCKKEASYFFLSYVLLANKDKSHFQRPPLGVEQMLASLDLPFIDSLDILINTITDKKNQVQMKTLRRYVDSSFLVLNNTAKYAIIHLLAFNLMRNAAISYATEEFDDFRMNFRMALITNAFADHFLQDAFAAGHLPVRRSVRGFDNKGVHDYYNKNGLEVYNREDKKWRTYGDSNYDSVTFERAIFANVASLEDLWNYFNEIRAAYARTGTSELTIYEKLHERILPMSEMPRLLNKTFAAFSSMPVPLDKNTYKAIALKKGSKSGAYLDLGVFSYGTADGPGWSAGLSPLGYVLSGYGSFKKNGETVSSKKETKLWIGLGANYSAFKINKFNVHKFTGKIDLCLFDRWLIENQFGCIKEGSKYFLWEPAIGYEFKSLRSSFAPSMKVFYDVSAYSHRSTGIMIAVRVY
jgi:hypothetical protein